MDLMKSSFLDEETGLVLPVIRLVQSGELLKRGRAIQQLQNTRTQAGLTSILPKTMMTSFLQNQIDSSYS